VAATLAALRGRHPAARLIAIFEPRSATSSRRLHQQQYAAAFRDADLSVLAPVGRGGIPQDEMLDVAAIAAAIRARGGTAETPHGIEEIVQLTARWARPGDVVVVMSNGPFGGIHDKLLVQLALRP
jgi:UDP-N-acetylmuramate: L-alanyl-gamma-D-glutamyl-meso-diaminopimelate ligase